MFFKQLRVKKRLKMSDENECSWYMVEARGHFVLFYCFTMITSLYLRFLVKGAKPLQLQKHICFKCKLAKSAMQSAESQLCEYKPRH